MDELNFTFKMPDDETLAKYISIKGEKGEAGDPTKLSQLENDTGFVTASTDALTNYYTKTQTDSAIDAAVESLETELTRPATESELGMVKVGAGLIVDEYGEISVGNSENMVFSFNNIDELKESSGLTNGTYVETYGYHESGDGGNGKYKIRAKTENDVIDDNKIIGIDDDLVGELINDSKIGTKLGVNLWTRHENIDDVKARIDVYKYMGVTDIVIVIQLDGLNCTVTEDVDVVNQAIAYAKSKKIEVNTIKFHCTNSNLNTSSEYRALYQQHCEDLLDNIEGTTIERVIILNEKNAWFNDSATQEQVDICTNMIAHFKALGYEVSITVAGLRYFLDCHYFHPEVTNSFDFIAINDYPSIGDNKQFTSEKEVKEAYETLYAFASQIKSWYPSKDFILSEIGVQNVWESLSSPANWRIKDMEGVTSSEGRIIPLYFSGLLNDKRLDKVFSGVWLWYSEYYSEYPEQTKIFRDKFVGGNN